MGLVFGMDEVGYGPNLGPLVVTVTCWEVPGDPRRFDFWQQLADCVVQQPRIGDDRLHVADSKQVYQPARGLAGLERTVLTLLRAAGVPADCFQRLCSALVVDSAFSIEQEPWFDGCDLVLPRAADSLQVAELASIWQESCRQAGIRLRGVRSEIVLTRRFNEFVRSLDSKGIALSRISLQLLRSLWGPDDGEDAFIVADKHGGRNRYDELLADVLDGQMIFRREEGRERSEYRVGTADIHFRKQAEVHFPVAVASMISKYVRELSMALFNQYWCGHVPQLKPTAGYPVDARRFKAEIADAQLRLGIVDDDLWRHR